MYIVKSTNKRGFVQESEEYTEYKNAFFCAMVMKDSGQYSVITILKYDASNNTYFLHRIIK